MRANFVVSGVWEGIRRNATMTIALVLSTAIALSFVSGAILADKEISNFKRDYENRLNVSVYLCAQHTGAPCKGPTTPAQQAALYTQLKQYPRVTSVTPISEKEAYERVKQLFDPKIAAQIQPGTVPASFTIKLKDLRNDFPAFFAAFHAAPGVSNVSNKVAELDRVLDFIDSFRLGALLIALVVLIASILLIANTIQVAAAQRRNETSIMRLVGASRWMTELPFMLESIIAVAIGGIVSFGFVALARYYILTNIFPHQVAAGVIPNLTVNDVLIGCGISVIGGIALSAITAFMTLRLYVKL